MYIALERGRQPLGDKYWCQQKALILLLLCCWYKKIALKSDFIYIFFMFHYISHLMTKPTKWHVRPLKTQIGLGIHPVWSESSLWAWRKLGFLATHWLHSEDSWLVCAAVQADQSLLGAHAILFVLSWGSSIIYIAPGRGRQSTGNKLLMTTDRPFLFAHMLQVSKWSLRNLITYTF